MHRWPAAGTLATASGILVAAWLACIVPAVAQNQSLGVSPIRIDIPDAQPGQSYVRPLSLQNQFDTPSTITVEADGAIAAWVKTDPGDGFTIPSRTARLVDVHIEVPAGTGPGAHLGEVRFTTEAKSPPSGSGSAVRSGVAVPINVTVGGEARVHLTWLDAHAVDVDPAASPHGNATVLNDGNVATTARLRANVTRPGQGEVLGQGGGELRLDPGAKGTVAIAVAGRLGIGQYTMHLASEDGAFRRDLDFKVVPGGLAPQGLLRGILHVPRATAGQLVRLDGYFTNTGTLPITAAQLRAEARQGEQVLAPLSSETVAVAPGASVNLTVYWTPPGAGEFVIVGHVNYDGFVTPEAASPLLVDGSGAALPWWLWLIPAAIVLAIGAWLLARRRKAR